MIVIKTEHQLEIMREAAKVTAYILDEMMEKIIRPGITTATIDRLVEAEIRKNHMVPAFKGLYGFPASVCASVNETIVHGIPSSRKLVEGDIISIDTGTSILTRPETPLSIASKFMLIIFSPFLP